MSLPEAIERELQMLKTVAGAPQSMRLGCAVISHDRLGFCSACEPVARAGSVPLELLAWRLLAMQEPAGG